jgi:hypothetical protein
VALIDIKYGQMTFAQFEALRELYNNDEISRKEFLYCFPAHMNPMIDSHGYLTPTNPAPFEISEPINSRFDILDL